MKKKLMFTAMIVSLAAVLSLGITGCGQEPGPDSISSHGEFEGRDISSLDCTICHSDPWANRRAVTGAQGDFGTNASIQSHHVAGSADPVSTQCLVCHDLSQHMSGIVRLRHADTDTVIAYDPSNNSTLEPFCLSCHDTDGASATYVSAGSPMDPFNDGSLLGQPPYPFATRIADSWAKTYGHGPNGNHSAGAKLTCLGNGLPGTGCHGSNGGINAHGSVFQIIGARQFTYDLPGLYSEAYFDLCFNCHASYSNVTKEYIFGVMPGGLLDGGYGPPGPNGNFPPYYIASVMTHFADHNEPGDPYGLNDPNFFGQNMNLHWMHITIQGSHYRGTGTTSGITCVNCHDVHGSITPYGAVYDELGYVNITTADANTYGKMADPVYSGVLNNYPTYCSFNCHNFMGVTRAWFDPIIE